MKTFHSFHGLQAALAMLLASLVFAGASAETKERPPSLLLITLDTTRADHLGAYGWPWARTPHLDALAARGVLFERCDSAAPITLPSHASLLTGLYPPRHGVRDNGSFRLPSEAETLVEILQDSGYDTAAVVSSVVLKKHFGLGQGFRIYDDEMTPSASEEPAHDRKADAVTDRALELLPGLRSPFLLWAHYYDPHGDYQAPPETRRLQKGPHGDYDAEIAFMDQEIGRLLQGMPPETTVLVVGDHGEMLGDHGESTHGVLLHAGSRRVPLLLAGPGLPRAKEVTSLVRTVDVAPTLLEIAGAKVPAGLDGESLLPVVQGLEVRHRPSYSESLLPFLAYRWHPLRALSDGRELFVDGAVPRLFDLKKDPEELRNLAPGRAAAVRRWSHELEALRSTWPEEDAEARATFGGSEEERRALAALGYLGGGGSPVAAATGDLPDPYDLVDIAGRLHELVPIVNGETCTDETLEELRSILRRSRENLPALKLAGVCLMGREAYEEALLYFRHAVKINEGSAEAQANLAGCLLRLEKVAEAEKAYRKALTLDPSLLEARANLSAILRRQGNQAAALETLADLPAGTSLPAELLVERGLTQAETGRVPAALEDFEAALELQPSNPVALENAARAAYQLQRAPKAASLYRRLLTIQPQRGDLWKTLGALELYALGQIDAARRSFERALEVEEAPDERRELQEMLRELSMQNGPPQP